MIHTNSYPIKTMENIEPSLPANVRQENDLSGRRDFIKKTALGAAGLAFGISAKSYASILGANDRVRVGIVGFSNRFKSSLLPSFLEHAKELNFEFVAIS